MKKPQETYCGQNKHSVAKCLDLKLGELLRTPKEMKQLKTSYKDLRSLYDQNIKVRHVCEKLQSCNSDDDALVVRDQMNKLDFDVMGLMEEDNVYGYVEQSNLGIGPCSKYKKIFLPSELIAESTPLIDLLTVLRDTPRMFVLDRNNVSGIVTRGDLRKAPVRMLLFGLVSLIEMHLLRLVRIHYPEDSWQSQLTETRLNKANELFAERKARNEAIDLADCLQFCDKTKLVMKIPEIRDSIRREFGKLGKTLLNSTEKLRDKLAHAQDIVTGTTWPELIDLVREIERLLKLFESI